MELNEFIIGFADQFDDTDSSEITATTVFHDLDEWSSLTALSVMNYAEKACGNTITFDEMRNCVTVQDLYNVVNK